MSCQQLLHGANGALPKSPTDLGRQHRHKLHILDTGLVAQCWAFGVDARGMEVLLCFYCLRLLWDPLHLVFHTECKFTFLCSHIS